VRVGIGYDRHAVVLSEGASLCIGGLEVARGLKFEAHSDGDVLLHAVCDALIGALGMGDLGEIYPADDPRWKGVKSSVLLKEIVARLREMGHRIVNLDSVVVGDVVPLKEYRRPMVIELSRLLEVEESRVNVKFKRSEGMGFESSVGFSAYAVVLIE
jgi:2-C-methyl-D-erythritol 2,4-cyclodiphosphate synthase